MNRLRRRLLLGSAPVAAAALILVMLPTVTDSGRDDVAEGFAAAQEGRLDDAERAFSAALEHADGCPARVNLTLVRETRGDRAIAGAEADITGGLQHYRDAQEIAVTAPPGCSAGNGDADPDRRAVRNDTVRRLDAKIAAVEQLRPPVPSPPTPAPPPPAQSPVTGSPVGENDTEWRLHPGRGDPLDRLRQMLRDSALSQPLR